MPAFYITDYFSTSSDPYKELNKAGGSALDLDLDNLFAVEDPTFEDLAGFEHVRRPHRGIQLKDDAYATMWVEDANGRPKFITNESYQRDDVNGPYHTRTSNFLLQSVSESRAEKQQIVETFGPTYVFFFGERPRVLDCRGVLLNTADFAWKNEWWKNYDEYFRGTRLVKSGGTFKLQYDDVTAVGYVMNANAVTLTEQPYHIMLSFQIFLVDVIDHHSWSTRFPTSPYTALANPLDIPDYPTALTATPAGKVRSLALADYLADQSVLNTGKLASAITNPGAVLGAAGAFPYATLKKIEGFLYGRPEIVPKGFAGSEAIAGLNQLTLAGGTALSPFDLDTLFGGALSRNQIEGYRRAFSSANQSFATTSKEIEAKIRTKFRENYDEFPSSGYTQLGGRTYELDAVAKEGQFILQQSNQQGRDLLLAEDEAKYFENVSRSEFQARGIDPDGYSAVARAGFAVIGTAIAASGAFLLAPDAPAGRAAADSDSADQWGIPGSARTRFEGHVPNDTPRWWEDVDAQGSRDRKPFSTAV